MSGLYYDGSKRVTERGEIDLRNPQAIEWFKRHFAEQYPEQGGSAAERVIQQNLSNLPASDSAVFSAKALANEVFENLSAPQERADLGDRDATKR